MSQQQNDDFNTEALFKEVNNVIQRGLSEILENHKLYEATHNALMNLPSIKQEFSKYKEKEDKEKQKEQEIANWWNIIRSNENNSYFTSKYSCDNNKNNGDDDDMPELISCSEAGEDVKQLVKRVVEEEIHASNNKMHEVLNTTFVSLFQELKELKELFPDVAAGNFQYKAELEKIAVKQIAFNENTAITSNVLEGTGVEMEQVADLFDKTNRSLSDVSIGLTDFNKLIGMTGDVAVRIANGAGRFARTLLQNTQSDMNVAESRSRLEEQIKTMFTSGSVDKNQGTIVAGQTMNEIIGNAMSELSAGNVNFKDLVGTSDTDKGKLIGQAELLLKKAKDRGVDQDIINQLEKSLYGDVGEDGTRSGGMVDQIKNARTDPFARMQFDGQFSTDFENAMTLAVSTAATAIQGGTKVGDALDTGTSNLVAFLKKNGMTIDAKTEEKIRNMLGGSIQNSAAAMQMAMVTGGKYAADAIRAALTGGAPPAVPLTGGTTPTVTGSGGGGHNGPLGGDGPFKNKPMPQGDTTSSRFAATLASHSRFNSMVAGKRSITSGVRNTNLGSMGSDHKSGRAYDLVGDNLVSYADTVKGAGGFAEFHGSPGGGSRHLHVVPPQGDSSSPAMVGGGNGSTYNYNIEVVGSPGMDVNSLAETVMEKIRRTERSNRERS